VLFCSNISPTYHIHRVCVCVHVCVRVRVCVAEKNTDKESVRACEYSVFCINFSLMCRISCVCVCVCV